jgi:hypothetical protein
VQGGSWVHKGEMLFLQSGSRIGCRGRVVAKPAESVSAETVSAVLGALSPARPRTGVPPQHPQRHQRLQQEGLHGSCPRTAQRCSCAHGTAAGTPPQPRRCCCLVPLPAPRARLPGPNTHTSSTHEPHTHEHTTRAHMRTHVKTKAHVKTFEHARQHMSTHEHAFHSRGWGGGKVIVSPR